MAVHILCRWIVDTLVLAKSRLGMEPSVSQMLKVHLAKPSTLPVLYIVVEFNSYTNAI